MKDVADPHLGLGPASVLAHPYTPCLERLYENLLDVKLGCSVYNPFMADVNAGLRGAIHSSNAQHAGRLVQTIVSSVSRLEGEDSSANERKRDVALYDLEVLYPSWAFCFVREEGLWLLIPERDQKKIPVGVLHGASRVFMRPAEQTAAAHVFCLKNRLGHSDVWFTSLDWARLLGMHPEETKHFSLEALPGSRTRVAPVRPSLEPVTLWSRLLTDEGDDPGEEGDLRGK